MEIFLRDKDIWIIGSVWLVATFLWQQLRKLFSVKKRRKTTPSDIQMPNIRQLRKRERKTRKWTLEAMELALQEVEAGRLSVRQAAKQLGIPKTTLRNRVSGRVSSDCAPGQRTLLTPEDENSLVEYCLYSASHGFPLTKPQVVAHALAIYNLRHPEAPKTALGQTWWINFRERHHHRLTSRTPDIIDRGRASCAKRGPIEEYFRLLTTTLEEHGLREKPRQIYNCDETGFQLAQTRRKVIVPRGTKHAYRQAQGTRDHITVLACFNAAGEDIPPFIIYKGGYPGGPYNKEGVPDALYGKSPAGYMDGELFRKWFVGHFLKFATQERPLLLVMDGHQSHLDPELVRAAQREGVILLCLPPHTSHILQPLDVSFFGPLKADFSGVTGDLSAVSHSFLVSKKEFSRVLRSSYQRLKDRRVVVAGFRRCGLYPLDPLAIDWSRVMPSGPRHRTSPPLPAPSASSWAVPDATHPRTVSPLSVAPPSSPLAPASSPHSHPSPAAHPLTVWVPAQQTTAPPLPPPSSNPYLTHPLVASGRISADLAHLLAEINYARNTGRVRRNTSKARVLTAQEMSGVIEEAEDRAARAEAQALARRDREQQRAEDISLAATSCTLPGGSRPSRRRRVPLGAAPAASSGRSIAGPSAQTAPSVTSHGPWLPAPSSTPSPMSLPAGDIVPTSMFSEDQPSTSVQKCGLQGSQMSSSPSHQSIQLPTAQPLSSSFSSSTGPTTSTGHTAQKRRQEANVWRCGRCRKPEPPGSPEGLVSWVQCDNCHKWFHTICVGWEEEELEQDYWCYWCRDI